MLNNKEINDIAFKIMESGLKQTSPILNQRVFDFQMQNAQAGLSESVEQKTTAKTLTESNAHARAVVGEKTNPFLQMLKESRIQLAKAAKAVKAKGLAEEFDAIANVVKEMSDAMEMEMPEVPSDAPMMQKKPVVTENACESLKSIENHVMEGCGHMDEWKKMHEDATEEEPKAMISEAHGKMHKAAMMMAEAQEMMAGGKKDDGKEAGKVASLDVIAMEDVENALNRFGLVGLLEGISALIEGRSEEETDENKKSLYQVESKIIGELVKTLEG